MNYKYSWITMLADFRCKIILLSCASFNSGWSEVELGKFGSFKCDEIVRSSHPNKNIISVVNKKFLHELYS